MVSVFRTRSACVVRVTVRLLAGESKRGHKNRSTYPVMEEWRLLFKYFTDTLIKKIHSK